MTFWYRSSLLAYLLAPISWIYRIVIAARRWCYKIGLFKTHQLNVPVIVVGNITVGGTGKTPFVIALVEKLKEQGRKPGVISRGYGARAPKYPLSINEHVSPSQCGDEPYLIAMRTQCPVVVDPNRPRAACYLLENKHCDVIISDDGLQHYALGRDYEIALHRKSNGFCLPSGPLREPLSRLKTVDYVLEDLKITHGDAYQLNHSDQKKPLSEFNTVHAVAGIAHPERFFSMLEAAGLNVIKHSFPDHHAFRSDELVFTEYPVIMTEKDAVKCRDFSLSNHWVLPINVEVPIDIVLS